MNKLLRILPGLFIFSLLGITTSEAQLFKKRKQAQAAREAEEAARLAQAARDAQPPLAPGQFEWHPERAPSGPLLVVVSIDNQLAYVYRNGVQIARTTVSTGAPGHETPTGVFTILQKNKDHESNIYKGAKMPNMQRLTWSGIAMHAGHLPGYPASHGCIRLPLDFSAKLFEITEMGCTVVITKQGAPPSSSERPASILLASNVDPTSRPNEKLIGKTLWDPNRSLSGPVNFLLSGEDRTIYVYRNGILIGQSPVYIRNPDRPIPAGVFLMLEGTLPGENMIVPGRPVRPWVTISLENAQSISAVSEIQSRLHIPGDFGRLIYELAKPGTIIVCTAQASTPQTQTKSNFTVIRPQGNIFKKQ